MSRARTINVHGVYIVDSELDAAGKLVLVLGGARYRVRVHMEDYLSGAIGQRLHEHLNRRQNEINAARKKLRGEA